MTSSELEFYDGYSLYKVTQDHRVSRFVAHRDPDLTERTPLVVLNGKSPRIHSLNRTLLDRKQLKIQLGTARHYLRFFGMNVHAEQGAFSIVGSIGDLDWRLLTEGVQDAWSGVLHPVESIHRNATGDIALLAFVNYGRDLWLCLFLGTPQGKVEMRSGIPVFADLPVHPHTLDANRDAGFVLLA